MAEKFLEQLKVQSFRSSEEQAYISLIYVAEQLQYGVERLLKEKGLTQTQYNALRILRGAGTDGLTCNEIGSRMVKRVPDTTRLLDRMEKFGLLTRERQRDNRRVVIVRITEKGLTTVHELDEPVANFHKEHFARFTDQDKSQFVSLLEKLYFGESG